MNWWLNGSVEAGSGAENPIGTPEDKTKTSQLSWPPPSQIFVVMDEHEDSIDDGSIVIGADKYGYVDQWLDIPAQRHDEGANLSFADGHAEHWRWKAAKTGGMKNQTVTGSADHQDLYRLKSVSIPDLGR